MEVNGGGDAAASTDHHEELSASNLIHQNNALPEDVKNLGRKARARLEHERSKRREIVRVDVLPPKIVQRVAVKRSAFVDAMLMETSKKSGTAPRKRVKSSNKVDNVVDDRNVDRWMPDISNIPLPSLKESRSSVVQMHGLPVGTTPAHISRFFSGLSPQRILILPTSNQLANLHDLDARYDIPRKAGLKVDRYKHHLRILVKFDSAPTAALAAQRSGEVMQVMKLKGASIAVTQMLKNTATYFVKKLAMDAQPGVALEITLSMIETNLNPVIATILWSAAINNLQLKVDFNRAADTYHVYRKGLSPCKSRSKSETTSLQQHRAMLLHEVDALKNKIPFPAAEPLDPATLQLDPVMKLSNSCLGILHDEIERIDNALLVAARWNFLVATRPVQSQVEEGGRSST
jgi:hypothetical protein